LEGVLQRNAVSGKLKETASVIRWPHIDDLIVRLHEDGENVFQATARVEHLDGVTRCYGDLFAEMCKTGRVLLASGQTTELPRLDAAGVAVICEFELGCADYEADRVLVEEPVVLEHRVAATELWPALRRNGYKTGSGPARWNDEYTSPARLAELTHVPVSKIRRICADERATVRGATAMALLRELDEWEAGELEARLMPWENMTANVAAEWLDFEYIRKLAHFAQQWRSLPFLDDDERQALNDIIWISVAAQRKSFLHTTPAIRLRETREAFRRSHDREPTPLTRRLREQARRFFDREAASADARARALRQGLHRQGATINANTVAVRTSRLRKAGRLPAKSKPKHYAV
jgi:hypothetical protein